MKKIAFLTFILTTIVFSSCYVPSPLYGKWADNNGDSITFISDGTFVAKILSNDGTKNYEGEYSVIDNVLIFSESDGTSINTEWDIRGSMLFLTWTFGSENTTKNLTLYHVSR